MICYKDRTFCAGGGCLKFKECPRALTDDVREAARLAGLLISQFANPKELDCYAAPTTQVCSSVRQVQTGLHLHATEKEDHAMHHAEM